MNDQNAESPPTDFQSMTKQEQETWMENFYNSLTDEQKLRLQETGPVLDEYHKLHEKSGQYLRNLHYSLRNNKQ